MYRRCASPYPHDSFPAENSARHVRQNPLPIASIYIIDHFSFRQDNRTQNPRGVLPEQRSAGIYDWFMAAHPPFPCGCSTPPVLRLMLVRVVVEISEYQYFKTFLTCLYYIPIVDSSNYSRCSHECSLLLSAFLAPLVCGGKWELCAVQALGMAGENRQRSGRLRDFKGNCAARIGERACCPCQFRVFPIYCVCRHESACPTDAMNNRFPSNGRINR